LSLTGDLFDRFSAPAEHRFSRHQTERLLQQAGLEPLAIRNNRGWMALASKTPVLAEAVG
jgi:hypothetical protein